MRCVLSVFRRRQTLFPRAWAYQFPQTSHTSLSPTSTPSLCVSPISLSLSRILRLLLVPALFANGSSKQPYDGETSATWLAGVDERVTSTWYPWAKNIADSRSG
jgi:hypothetical protein